MASSAAGGAVLEGSGQRVVGQWVLGTHIGAGSFAIVWRAQHLETGQEAAVKEINLSKLNAKLRQSLESEVSILKRINHENIVTLHEVLEEADRLYLVMEYCAGGDLAHFLRRVKRVPEATAQHLMRQLAAGLRQMWAHHLVHRDLKPQNLLLSRPDPHATLKIADFGFARNLQPQGLAETLCGSPLYMAPEILHFHKYDAKADLWSIGAILYELVVGRPPFTGANQFQLLRNIERSEARVPEAIAAQLSPPCKHLIHCLLRRNPVERLSFEEFFRHPFVATPEEAAAPLPPRAPFSSSGLGGGLSSGGIASSLAAAASGGGKRAAPQQQRTLLFSTSAPAAAAAAALVKSRSANSIPQQVLGFQQQQQPPSSRLGPGFGAPGSAGAAVPVGGLSNQLKPRRSLDLDGDGATAAQRLLQQQAAAAQQALPQQRRPQPVPGHRLGNIQRVQGFQPPPLPGQSAAAGAAGVHQQSPFATSPAGTAAGTSLAAHQHQRHRQALASPPAASHGLASLLGGRARQQQQQQQQQQPPAAQQQAVAPPSQQQQQQQAVASGGSAAAAGGGSVHHSSSEEDFVMVDSALSAHTAGARSKQASPEPSRSASAEASLAGSRHICTSLEEDIFAAHPGDSHPTTAAAEAAAAAPAWLGTSRWRYLQRVAHALQAAAAACAAAWPGQAAAHQNQPLREYLSLHLAALQLLDHALEAHAEAVAAAPPPAAAGAAGQQAEAVPPLLPQQQAPEDGADALAAAAEQLRREAAVSMQAAEEAVAALHKAGREPSPTSVTPASAAAAEAEAALPDPWELLYAAALGWGREAAVDELLGNQQRSCRLYARAGAVLSFLSTEAAGLELEPPAELAPADRARLQKYAAATAARWAACAASAGSATAASPTA